VSKRNSRSLAVLSDLLYGWGYDRGFFEKGGATLEGQLKQMLSEVGEFALEAGADTTNQYVELGDILVTVLMMCHVMGVQPEYCLGLAYDKIKDRKGRMIKGKFVKESDL